MRSSPIASELGSSDRSESFFAATAVGTSNCEQTRTKNSKGRPAIDIRCLFAADSMASARSHWLVLVHGAKTVNIFHLFTVRSLVFVFGDLLSRANNASTFKSPASCISIVHAIIFVDTCSFCAFVCRRFALEWRCSFVFDMWWSNRNSSLVAMIEARRRLEASTNTSTHQATTAIVRFDVRTNHIPLCHFAAT